MRTTARVSDCEIDDCESFIERLDPRELGGATSAEDWSGREKRQDTAPAGPT